MSSAARVGALTSHAGLIVGPGVATVLVEGRPAAVTGDTHSCRRPPPSTHPPTPLGGGSATVLMGGRPVLRVGDPAGCGAVIVEGAATVLIGG